MNKKIVAILAAIMAAVMVLSLLLGLLVTAVSAASSDEIQSQIDKLKGEKAELDEKLQELEDNLAVNNNEMRNLVSRKNGIDQQIQVLNQQIKLVNQTIAVQNLLIADAQEELDMAQEKLEIMQQTFAKRIRVMEEQGEVSYWAVIFKATSFADLLSRLTMVVEIARADQQQLAQLRQLAAQVEEAKHQLEQAKQEMEQNKQELQQAQEELYVKTSEADGLLLSLIVKSSEYRFQLDEGEKLQHDLMEEIAHNQDLYDEAKYQEWLATSVPPTTTTAPTTAPTTPPSSGSTGGHLTNTVNGITWVTPTKNYALTSRFGWRTHPVTGEPDTFHYGIDLGAAQGTPIYATRDGKVRVTAYQENGAGWYVSIDHYDGYISVYMHMTHYIVYPGQRVKAGDIIGYVGSTGKSTGPHLHFGIAYKGTYVDPLDYIAI